MIWHFTGQQKDTGKTVTVGCGTDVILGLPGKTL